MVNKRYFCSQASVLSAVREMNNLEERKKVKKKPHMFSQYEFKKETIRDQKTKYEKNSRIEIIRLLFL